MSQDNLTLILEAMEAGMLIPQYSERNVLVLALSKLKTIDIFHKILYFNSMIEPQNILSDYVDGRHIIDYHNGLADIPMPSYADVILLNTVGPQRLIRTIKTDETFVRYCKSIMKTSNRGHLTPTDYYYHLCLEGTNVPSKLTEQEINMCRLAVGNYNGIVVNDQTAADVIAHAKKISAYPTLWAYQRPYLMQLIDTISKQYKMLLCQEDVQIASELFGIPQDQFQSLKPEIRGYFNNCPIHIHDDYSSTHPLKENTSINEENTIGEKISSYRDFDRIDVSSGSGVYTFTREEFPTLLEKGTNFYTNEPISIRCLCEIKKRITMAKMMDLPECLPADDTAPLIQFSYRGQVFTPVDVSPVNSSSSSSSSNVLEQIAEFRDLLRMIGADRSPSSPDISAVSLIEFLSTYSGDSFDHDNDDSHRNQLD